MPCWTGLASHIQDRSGYGRIISIADGYAFRSLLKQYVRVTGHSQRCALFHGEQVRHIGEEKKKRTRASTLPLLLFSPMPRNTVKADDGNQQSVFTLFSAANMLYFRHFQSIFCTHFFVYTKFWCHFVVKSQGHLMPGWSWESCVDMNNQFPLI